MLIPSMSVLSPAVVENSEIFARGMIYSNPNAVPRPPARAFFFSSSDKGSTVACVALRIILAAS
jgi:hypothetical protein